MHLAYSAISPISAMQPQITTTEPAGERQLRYQAYQTACNKYSREIAAIQKYIPGWVPKFR
ncbi:MAG: hypothetical protein ACXVJD_01445 [Mucilaginibacter sp.]